MATKMSSLFKGKDNFKEARAIKSGKISPAQYARGEKSEDAKKGKPFAAGGAVRGTGAAVRGKGFKGGC